MLRLHSGKFHKECEKYKAKAILDEKECTKKLFSVNNKGQWSLCKELGAKRANPLIAVERTSKGPKGQPKNSFATDPKEIDAIIREAYGRIYA